MTRITRKVDVGGVGLQHDLRLFPVDERGRETFRNERRV